MKFLIKSFKNEQSNFTDAQKFLSLKPKIYINSEGKLFYCSPAISGEIFGISEYNNRQKKLFKLPLDKPAIDFLIQY